MSSSFIDSSLVKAQSIGFARGSLIVELTDGRSLSVPLTWFPRLARGTAAERANWRLIGRGVGIHWPALDEDISVVDLLFGRPSGESKVSFQGWLESRATKRRKRRSTSGGASRTVSKRGR